MTKLKITDIEQARPTMLKMGFSPEAFEKEAGFACSIWNDPKNGYLRKATKESLLKSVINIAQTSLTLNPIAREAFLIPRSDKGTIQCNLEPSYMGLVKLLTDAGSVTSINTQLVYEEDEFEINLASDEPVRHIPNLTDRKTLIGVYAIAKLATGEKQVEWMEIKEVNKIRDTSDSYKAFLKDNQKQTIWNTYYGEMVRKTVLKRIYKYLPRTDRMQKFDAAVKLTNRDFEASSSQVAYAESLINTSVLLESQKEQLLRELATCNSDEVGLMIDYLNENQPKPGIESGIHSEAEAADATMEAADRDKDPELF
jgi:phage RecT family recombinase